LGKYPDFFVKTVYVFCLLFQLTQPIYFTMSGTYTEKVNYKEPKLDEYGNPVINFKSMKGGTRDFFK
jgi:hypothetical protein